MLYSKPFWGGLGLINHLTPLTSRFDWTHDWVCLVLVLILFSVASSLAGILFNPWGGSWRHKWPLLETLWTAAPMLLLATMIVPSVNLLYSLETSSSASVTLKVIGHQWYWSYEYGDLKVSFDSYLNPTPPFHLLDTDQHVVLPIQNSIRALVSSSDVLHSWALPALGVKVDACPGRSNLVFLESGSPSLMVGQCSEICGTQHAFMPIVLEFVLPGLYKTWVQLTQP